MSDKRILPLLLIVGIALFGILLCNVLVMFRPWARHDICIAPPVSVAFPPDAAAPPGYRQTPVPVASIWEPQLSQRQRKTVMQEQAHSIVARSSDDIWVIASVTAIVNYRPSIGKLYTYTIQVGGDEFVPRKLFLAQDGTLWGVGKPSYVQFKGFLSRYDATEDRFVAITDAQQMLFNDHRHSFETVAEDSQGHLWFAVNNTLIRYNPTTEETERINTQDWGLAFTYFTIAADDTLWLSAASQTALDPKTYRVYRYDPHTGSLQDYGTPPGAYADAYAHNFNLAFDRSGRLWASDFGWLEFSTPDDWLWYQVIRSPVFIHDRIHGSEKQYYWSHPQPPYESSDGYFWFQSGAGVVRLDLEQGAWCLMTTVPGDFFEDEEHNLWLAGDGGQIYKYRLHP
ncbi:MAG: hypothetical protein JXA33_08715 [Anaerolineae bacterium]|nr:hypothetical protein [Anaerolineae bacterium]